MDHRLANKQISRRIIPLQKCEGDKGLFNAYVLKEPKTGLYYVQVEDKEPHHALFDFVSKEYIESRFYQITCSNVNFVNQLNLNKEMFLFGSSKRSDDISMTQSERNFLFNFIKKIMPRKIMEFSPFHGFSTLTICDALAQVNIHPDFFETHEIDKENTRLTNFNLYENNVDFVKVIEGDVFQALDREKLKEVDFLLVDSDHSGGFARHYVDDFFPLLKDGCWIAIHDISPDWYFASPERDVVIAYFEKNKIDTYFHIEDLMKMYQIVDDDFIWSQSRNTLLFWCVKK